MDLFDAFILVNMGLLALLFAIVAVLNMRDEARSGRADAHVIRHPGSERRTNRAA